MLSKDELVIWADKMFCERQLTKEEQEDEIKKFREGVAPLYPSFIINQETLINKLKNSFYEFYSKSRVMEAYVIVGNPGQGKSHILNIINSYLSSVKNNVVINERAQGFGTKFDMVSLILNKVNSPIIIKALTLKVKEIVLNTDSSEEYIQITEICNHYDVSLELATLLWKLTFSSSEVEKIRALNVLTSRDHSQNTLSSLGIEDFDKDRDILSFFYIIMSILKEKNIFVVILIEELEHIFKWKPEARLKFYEQLKEFIDNSQKLGNLFVLMFSTYVLNDEYQENNYTNDIISQDSALYTRLQPKVLKIKKISSREEAQLLIEKLVERYEKLYSLAHIDIDKLLNEIEANVKNETYRSYIQKTAAFLDKLIDNSEATAIDTFGEIKKINTLEKEEVGKEKKTIDIGENQKQKSIKKILSEISNESSLATKKKILLSIKRLLELNQYKDIILEIKKGYLYALPKNKRNKRLFYLDYTSIGKVQEKYKGLVNLPDLTESLNCDKNNMYFIYLKRKVTDNAEKKLREYNPSIHLISLKEEDVIELLLLLEDELPEEEKLEISKTLASIFMLENGESNV